MLALIGPIGTPEAVIILVIVLVIFGPKKLPELGRSIGKGLKEFKESTSDVTKQFSEEVDSAEKEEKAETIESAKEQATATNVANTNAESKSPETKTS